MRELCFVEPERLEWRERPAPELEGEGEALVRPVAAANCDIDTAIVRGHAPFPGPFSICHEFVGEVSAIGSDVRSVKTGALVIVPWKVACGACPNCRRGVTSACTSVPPNAMYGLPIGGDWGGGISDLVRIPFADAMLVRVPDGLDAITLAAASDNLPDAWRCVAPYLKEQPGASVLIVGGGARSIGLYATGMAKALGAERVDYVDRDHGRLTTAADYGANPIEASELPQEFEQSEVTVDASGSAEGLACALRSTAPGGSCTSVATIFADAPLPMFEMYARGVTLRTGPCQARALLPEVLEFLETGSFQPGPVLAETVGWEEAPAAYARLTTKTVVSRPRELTST